MKKYCAILLVITFLLSACSSAGTFTAKGAATANAIVTKASQIMGVVQILIPALKTLVGLPAFVDQATPYLTAMQTAESALHDFINSHTDGQEVTTEQQAKVNSIEAQVNEAQKTTITMQTKATHILQTENLKLKRVSK